MKKNQFILDLKKIILLFGPKDRLKLFFTTAIQICLSIFDLVGLLLIGLLGAVIISGFQSSSIGNREAFILGLFNLETVNIQTRVTVLGLLIAVIFSTKTVCSIYLTKKSLYFVSRRGAYLSTKLVTLIFSNAITKYNNFSHQEIIYNISTGISNLTTRVLVNLIIIISDIVLLLVLFFGLLVINPIVSISSLLIFLIVAYVINKIMKIQAFALGAEEAALGLESNEKISEILNTYREATVRNTRLNYINEIQDRRLKIAEIDAHRNYIPRLNKYLIEITMISGILFVAGLQFMINNAADAISNLAIFLAAVTRIAPAVLRIQQGFISIQSGLGSSRKTIEFIQDVSRDAVELVNGNSPDFVYSGFMADISIKDLEFSYNSTGAPVLDGVNLDVDAGEHIAIVGSSGAGKTTLVDLILGIHSPTKGSITISGRDPLAAISLWPGALAYVPQDIFMVNGSVWQNITLGLKIDTNYEKQVWDALILARIDKLVKGLPDGFLSKIGESGYKLSGGEKQRIGIARALFTKPKLLILDEATSALDAETEIAVTDAIKSLKGNTTIIMIAHRLSSVRNADRVVFMSGGKIKSIGTFNEVRNQVPDFDKQANLMGL
jgi:ABC-type multidrug transport system fused ATPase/permease subunit